MSIHYLTIIFMSHKHASTHQPARHKSNISIIALFSAKILLSIWLPIDWLCVISTTYRLFALSDPSRNRLDVQVVISQGMGELRQKYRREKLKATVHKNHPVSRTTVWHTPPVVLHGMALFVAKYHNILHHGV